MIALLTALAALSELPLDAAIRSAWANNPGLRAAAAAVEGSREEAAAARDGRLPALELHAGLVRTSEPMAAFGLKLDEGRIGPPDFDPARLDHPDAVYGAGLGISATQVLYAGGAMAAGARAREAQAGADEKSWQRRRQELALAIVEAYFGALVAEQAVSFAGEQLAWSREVERFVRARVAQAQAPEAEAMRATAARAQAEAERAAVEHQLASARAALSLLIGEALGDRRLSTPLPPAESGEQAAGERPDLEAARLRVEAARAAADATGAALLPRVFLQVAAETMRSSLREGNVWTAAALGAKWELGMPALRQRAAARAREAASAAELQWRQDQAAVEVDEARRAADTAARRIAAAREATAASEATRAMRSARHREGLLPLTEVLDAQASLAGARTLLLRSQLELRVARARLQLALGNPIEGVKP
ncbi:MAG TPA: TolC family protein [Myxococcales bacterium]|nr:TolC family protein [Myxococcales bacterium]